MLSILGNRTYRHLFLAQALSLIGTGLTTVALGLLAYDLSGDQAGQVLGIALAIKMVAYVGLAPVAGALAGKVPRRQFLVSLDLCRAGMVLVLPFVTEIWQVYLLVFLFQACSAFFTPTFQATIPDILTDEKDYTNALSLSRLAYDLESLISPMVAGLLLTVVSFHWLFVGNGVAFVASAALVVSVVLPSLRPESTARPFKERLTRGTFIYLRTPRLRGLLALSFAVSSAGSMIIVNTVVYVRDVLGGGDQDVAFLFVSYGVGSMLVALILPRLLADQSPRTVMLFGGGLLSVALPLGVFEPNYLAAMGLWAVIGVGISMIMTPSGLLLRRSSHPEDRPALFAAQFALSHACWLIAYPMAGWLGSQVGLPITFVLLAVGVVSGCVAATVLWPSHDPKIVEHEHVEITHMHGEPDEDHHAGRQAEWKPDGTHRHQPVRHSHAFMIDDHHTAWPR